mmetsp:Transcript_19319/g.61904  ORF Transcript_19319/g.61904 Transcript_19319/m.61904 type:complete len:202 (-) Transcript_19319:101-706(-)
MRAWTLRRLYHHHSYPDGGDRASRPTCLRRQARLPSTMTKIWSRLSKSPSCTLMTRPPPSDRSPAGRAGSQTGWCRARGQPLPREAHRLHLDRRIFSRRAPSSTRQLVRTCSSTQFNSFEGVLLHGQLNFVRLGQCSRAGNECQTERNLDLRPCIMHARVCICMRASVPSVFLSSSCHNRIVQTVPVTKTECAWLLSTGRA